MQSQLQSFQSVRTSFGSQMDVEGHKKVSFVVKHRSFRNLFCVHCDFLDCAPLFLVTGETLILVT